MPEDSSYGLLDFTAKSTPELSKQFPIYGISDISSVILFELDFVFYFSQFAQIYSWYFWEKPQGSFCWLCVDLIHNSSALSSDEDLECCL